MAENLDRERGAQEEQPGQREKKRATSIRQDFTRPQEGRDTLPEDETVKKNRTTKSPWLGGG